MLRIFIPTQTIQDIKTLDELFEFGILSAKQYCIRKIRMLHPYFSQEIHQEVSQNQFLKNIKSERQHYNDLVEVLDKIEYLNLSQSNEEVQENPIEEQHIFMNDSEIATIPVENSHEKEDNNKENFIKHVKTSINLENQENCMKPPEKDFDKEQNNQTLNVIDINMQCETSLDNNNFKIPNNIYLSNENKENNNKIENNNEELSCSIEPEDNQTNLIKPREILVVNKEPTRSSMSRRTQHKTYIKKTRIDNNQLKITDMFKAESPPEIEIVTDVNSDLLIDNQATKKVKVSEKKSSISNENADNSMDLSIPNRCILCRQLITPKMALFTEPSENTLDEITLFKNHNEFSNHLHKEKNKPLNNLTCFSIYDQANHLCPFDSGLIERNVSIYCSGYIKRFNNNSENIKDGVLVKKFGPIVDWWVSENEIYLSTENAVYCLEQANESYSSFMNTLISKIFITKRVIELLNEFPFLQYEQLLSKLENTTVPEGLPPLNEDALINYSDFICDQVYHYDISNHVANFDLILIPCFRHLVKITGATLGILSKNRLLDKTIISQKSTDNIDESKNVITPVVLATLDSFAIPSENDENGVILKQTNGCELCYTCKNFECVKCPKTKGTSKTNCEHFKCPNVSVKQTDDIYEQYGSDLEEMLDLVDEPENMSATGGRKRKLMFYEKPFLEKSDTKYYKTILVGKLELKQTSFVLVKSPDAENPYIARIVYFFEKNDMKMFHAILFCLGSDTLLGNLSNSNEIFETNKCIDFNCHLIIDEVLVKNPGEQQQSHELLNPESKKEFIVHQKRYHKRSGRFEQSVELSEDTRPYPCCSLKERDSSPKPQLEELNETKSDDKLKQYSAVIYQGVRYTVGSNCYVSPEAFETKSIASRLRKPKTPKHDAEMYPEFYRKSYNENVSLQLAEPFCVGHILNIEISPKITEPSEDNIDIRIEKLFRSEETNKAIELSCQKDLNCLYWSDKEFVVSLSFVRGSCYVTYSENIPEDQDTPLSDWIRGGPDRFYFTQAYNPDKRTILEPPDKATLIGRPPAFKRKGGGRIKSATRKRLSLQNSNVNVAPTWPTNGQKTMFALDIFCGCGGLSEGLRQSGLSETKWIIEPDIQAAKAFKLNHPDCTVYTQDCNILLKQLLNANENGNNNSGKLPQKGEIDLICGSPPCQGFNDMIPFNSKKYFNFKNSFLVTFLSFCDFYRPKYIILENVDKFVNFKSGLVLKLTIRSLIDMGYQCSFGILQDADFGVASSVKRTIIIGAAAGQPLPQMPEPRHAFSSNARQLEIKIDQTKYIYPRKWSDSAPLRHITIRDAISDLPTISNGHDSSEISYGNDPETHLQRLLRCPPAHITLYDHICKQVSLLVETRLSHIPTAAGADWRDLPNIEVQLVNGKMTQKLIYSYLDDDLECSSKKKLLGVCCCSEGRPCDPIDRQYNTLIPWNLTHTAKRHQNWPGLYGRLEWDGVIEDQITIPEPMSKHGRVLHPSQPRVISVRECARIKGFSDSYRFSGSIYEKYNQISKSVPPPLAVAIGFEILKCLQKN